MNAEQPTFENSETEKLWWKLKSAVDRDGKFGDSQTEFGVVRRADIVFRNTKAELHITEQVDPLDFEGPFLYHMKRSDQRGSFELAVSTTTGTGIGIEAVRAAMRDVELYMGATEESMEH